MLSSGLTVSFGVAPAATVTIIVSPTARENASTNAGTMPESAAGNTILSATSNRVAPSA